MVKQNGTAALAPYTVVPGQLREAWAAMDLDQRRAVLGALIERIAVAPASRTGAPADAAGRRRFDPRRVTVQWRF